MNRQTLSPDGCSISPFRRWSSFPSSRSRFETLPGLSAESRTLLSAAETGIVALFTIEYALRVFVADRKLAFVFSFFGIIDLVAILPFYLALGIDLRSIRVFRLLRLFRVFKLARYSDAIQRFHRQRFWRGKSWFSSAVSR